MAETTLTFNVVRTGDSATKSVNNLSKSIDKLKQSSAKAKSPLEKLTGTMARIGKMMILRQIIRKIIEAMKEGLENAYKFNSIMGGEMSQALDRLKSASRQATGALGSAFGEMIATVAPILIRLLNLITKVANAFAQLVAVLGGRKTYTKAIESSEKWADVTAQGAKSAKEWKNQLMGFDEINRLEEPSDTDSGGGGANPYEGAFELVEAENEWAKQLRELTLDWWKNLNFEPLINAWERLKTAVGDFVDIVDDALYWAYTNVLLPFAKWDIEQFLPARIELLASMFEFLNRVLRWLQPYALWVWENWLKPLAQWTGNKVIEALKKLTKMFEDLTKYIDTLEGLSFGEAMQKIFDDVVKKIQDFNWQELGTKIYEGVKSALSFVKTKVTEIFSGDGLSTFFDNIFTLIGTVLGGLVGTLWGVIIGFLQDVFDKIAEWNGLEDPGKAIFDGILNGITGAIKAIGGFFKWIDEHIFAPFIKGFKEAFKINSPSKVMEEMGGYIMDGLGQGMKDNFHPIQDAVDSVKRTISSIAQTVSGAIGSVADLFNAANSATLQMNELNSATATHISLSGNLHGGSGGAFAEGGFPSTGELFIARESGPELVGSIGTRTAVANNDQIVSGIKQGVFEAVTQAMGNQQSGEVVLKLDGDILAKGVTKYQRFNAISANI